MIDPALHKQLFLDDRAIEQMADVTRVLHSPEKCGPVLCPDRSREQIALQSRSVPQWNSERGIWEWWYWGSYEVPPYGKYQSTSLSLVHYAMSDDGVRWETPSLGRYEWQGSKGNNVACDPEDGHRSLYHIIRDERDPDPGRRYKGLFGSKDREARVSPDGFDWTSLEVAVPSQDESHFLYDETSEQYLALVKQPTEWGRSVWLSTSRDFVSWTEPTLIFHSDEVDQTNRKNRIQAVIENSAYLSPPLVDDGDHLAQVYQMAVMPYEGLYIGFPVLFNPAGAIPPPHMNYTALNQVELTVSHNLFDWARVADRAVFIGVDPWDGENYGTAQNLLCGRPHVHDGREIWMYYNALRFRGPRELYRDVDSKWFQDAGALCLAKLRLDGFVSLDAEDRGEVVTKPFMLQGEDLYVNAEVKGELRAEVLDGESLRPLSGLSDSDCEPLQGDHLHGRINWQEPRRQGSARPVRLRFVMRDAKLYAFWLEK